LPWSSSEEEEDAIERATKLEVRDDTVDGAILIRRRFLLGSSDAISNVKMEEDQ
jgi:hypothetical protein